MRTSFIKAVGMLIVLLGTVHCSQTGMQSVKSKSGVRTFDSMSAEFGGSNTTNTISSVTHKLSIAPQIVKQCVAGEADLLQSAADCLTHADALITVKDQTGEKVLLKVALDGGANAQASVLSSFGNLNPYSVTISGDNADIFVCIDHNRNGQCADEAIEDLNDPAARLAALGGEIPDKNAVFCSTFSAGKVLYHSQYSYSATSPDEKKLADLVQHDLRNYAPTTGSLGEGIFISVPLVKSEPTQCQTQVRTDGCFIKGTQINVAKDKSITIEKFRSGSTIYLADGRTARVKKIVEGPEKKPVITIQTASGEKITVTSGHPLMTNKGVKMAKDISIGEELKTAGGTFAEIISISQRSYTGHVFNVELEGLLEVDHLIVAEGLVSGDLYLQNKLSKESSDIPKYLSAK